MEIIFVEVFLMNEKEKEYCLEVIKKHEEKPNYLKNTYSDSI